VDDTCYQLLPRPRLPLQQYRRRIEVAYGIEGGQVADLRTQRLDGWSLPYEAVSRVMDRQHCFACHNLPCFRSRMPARRRSSSVAGAATFWLSQPVVVVAL